MIRVDINLSRISAADRAAGFTMVAGIRAVEYKGDRASSLKPVSDGKFAPQPLILMSVIGGGQHELNIVRWQGAKLRSVQTRLTADYAYWRRHFLTRTPVGKFLSGGRATVEHTNDQQMYSLCFNMVRSRQSFAGYGR